MFTGSSVCEPDLYGRQAAETLEVAEIFREDWGIFLPVRVAGIATIEGYEIPVDKDGVPLMTPPREEGGDSFCPHCGELELVPEKKGNGYVCPQCDR